VNEYFLTIIHGKEAVALFGAKPFDYANTHHYPENLRAEHYMCPPRAAVMAPRPRRMRIRGAYNTRLADYQIVRNGV
jgi:hypothetical protein